MKINNAWHDAFHADYQKARLRANPIFETDDRIQAMRELVNEQPLQIIDIPNSPLDDVDNLSKMLPCDCWKLTYDNGLYSLYLFSHALNTPKSTFKRGFAAPTHKGVYMACLQYLIEEENYQVGI